jgi:hypothetical protein
MMTADFMSRDGAGWVVVEVVFVVVFEVVVDFVVVVVDDVVSGGKVYFRDLLAREGSMRK